MARVIFKSSCAGGDYYYFPGPEEQTIPDRHLAEIDPKCVIVIEASSPVSRDTKPAPGTLLREHDWLRKATTAEQAEVLRLREPEVVDGQQTPRRRSNVIQGAKL